jgi:hypothetical protein
LRAFDRAAIAVAATLALMISIVNQQSPDRPVGTGLPVPTSQSSMTRSPDRQFNL